MKHVEEFENEYWKKQDQELTPRHKNALKYINGGPVLDLGCGDGLLLAELKKRGINGEGLDLSKVAVDKCRARGIKARVFDFADKKLPYSNNSFKWVVLTDVLEHLYRPEKILAEAARIGEKVLIVVPNFNSLTARIQVMLGEVPENNTPRKGHIYWFNRKSLYNILKKSDLEVMLIESHFYKKDSNMAGLFKFLAKIFPEVFSLTFLVVAQRPTK